MLLPTKHRTGNLRSLFAPHLENLITKKRKKKQIMRDMNTYEIRLRGKVGDRIIFYVKDLLLDESVYNNHAITSYNFSY